MLTGLKFELIGVVQEFVEFDDQRSGEKVRGVRVGWLGGSHYFNCESLEQQQLFPKQDEPVRVAGNLLLDKGKAKLKMLNVKPIDAKEQKTLAG